MDIEVARKHREALIKHYQSAENKDFSRLLVDKSGNIIVDKDGAPTIQVFTTGIVKDTNDAEFTIDHLISTPRIDYVKDVMDPFGMDDTALQKNKGVFYNHVFSEQTSLPIGKNLWTKKQRDGVLACTKYAVNENPFAKDVYNLVKGGYLNSYSIGFKYDEYDIVSISTLLQLIGNKFDIPNVGEFDPATSVWYHKKWKCHEYSQVGVPMNQDAVKGIMRKALDANVITSDFGKQYFGSMAERVKTDLEGDASSTLTMTKALKSLKDANDELTLLVQALGTKVDDLSIAITGVSEKQDQCVVMLEQLVEEEPAPEAEASIEGEVKPEEQKSVVKPVEKAGEATTFLVDFGRVAAGAISGVVSKQ